MYPIVYLDALVVRSRASGAVQNKHVYLALGVNQQGEKEILGLWMSENEGARFWLSIMTKLKKPGFTGYLYRLYGWPERLPGSDRSGVSENANPAVHCAPGQALTALRQLERAQGRGG